MTTTRVVIDIHSDDADQKSIKEAASSFAKGVLTDAGGVPEVDTTVKVHQHDGNGCEHCNAMTYDNK